MPITATRTACLIEAAELALSMLRRADRRIGDNWSGVTYLATWTCVALVAMTGGKRNEEDHEVSNDSLDRRSRTSGGGVT